MNNVSLIIVSAIIALVVVVLLKMISTIFNPVSRLPKVSLIDFIKEQHTDRDDKVVAINLEEGKSNGIRIITAKLTDEQLEQARKFIEQLRQED